MTGELKYTDRDVRENASLTSAAYEYLENYSGEFSFLIDCKLRVEDGEALRVGHVRGILNCMRIDPRVRNLPEPLPPVEDEDEAIVIQMPKRDKKKRRRLRDESRTILCDIEDYHESHWGEHENGNRYDFCKGLYAINRPSVIITEARIKVPYVTAISSGSLIHKVQSDWRGEFHWYTIKHEYGYFFKYSRTAEFDEVPMAELVVKTECIYPRQLKSPLLLDAVMADNMIASGFKRLCSRCFPKGTVRL